MLSWLWSKYYDNIMQDAEEKNLKEWRKTLLSQLSGEVLELGSGTGANLAFYPATLHRLVLTEPCKYMLNQLNVKVSKSPIANIEIFSDEAESLSFPDASFDIVVSTLVLCSVKKVDKAIAEIHRVLRPQGKLIFIEHVAAKNNIKRYQWQRRLEFIWKRLAGGCHLTRYTEEAIIKAGFTMADISHQSIRGVPPVVRPSIRGVAIKS